MSCCAAHDGLLPAPLPGEVLTMSRVAVSSLCSGRTQPTPCSFLLLFMPFSPFPSQIGPISLCTPVPATVLRAGSLQRWWLGQLLAPQSPLSSRTAWCDFQSSGVLFRMSCQWSPFFRQPTLLGRQLAGP